MSKIAKFQRTYFLNGPKFFIFCSFFVSLIKTEQENVVKITKVGGRVSLDLKLSRTNNSSVSNCISSSHFFVLVYSVRLQQCSLLEHSI